MLPIAIAVPNETRADALLVIDAIGRHTGAPPDVIISMAIVFAKDPASAAAGARDTLLQLRKNQPEREIYNAMRHFMLVLRKLARCVAALEKQACAKLN